MRPAASLVLTFFLFCLTGCRAPSQLVNYDRIQTLALRAILAEHPDWKASDLELISIQSQREVGNGELIEVKYLRPATAEEETVGSARKISTKTVSVRLLNSGRITGIHEGGTVSFKKS